MKRVEGVDELVLGLFLALEGLDVVDQQRVELAVTPLEDLRAVLPQGGHEVGREPLRGGVVDRQLRAPPAKVVGDGAEQVRFAEPRRAVEEERVVGLARQLGDRQRRCVGHAVAPPDHETLEGMPRVEVEGSRAALHVS